jgi:hypothetical protein
MIEAAILGRPVLSLMTGDFAGTQEGTLHFRYLLPENGGFLRVANTLEQHAAQLAEVLHDPEVVREQTMRFVNRFLRPQGLSVPCTPILADTFERVAATGSSAPSRETPSTKIARIAVRPLALVAAMAVRGLPSWRLRRPNVGVIRSVWMDICEEGRRARRAARHIAYEGYDSGRRTSAIAYSRTLKRPVRRVVAIARRVPSMLQQAPQRGRRMLWMSVRSPFRKLVRVTRMARYRVGMMLRGQEQSK